MIGSDVRLRIGGVDYVGWTSIDITRSIDSPASVASIGMTDEGRRIHPGLACEVLIGETKVITGWTVGWHGSASARSWQMTVNAASKTCDLVECSHKHATGQIRGMDLYQLASTLAEPYGVAVAAEADYGGPIPHVALRPGEKVYEVIERLAREKGLLVTDTPEGFLLLTTAGAHRATCALVLGDNLIQGALDLDWSKRFKSYVCKGQAAGSDLNYGDSVALVANDVADEWIGRERTLTIQAEGPVDGAGAKRRATWEAATRYGQSIVYYANVGGWRQGETGPLWLPNHLCFVQDERNGIYGELLIVETKFSLSERGAPLTSMVLSPREGYLPEPPKRTGGSGRTKKTPFTKDWFADAEGAEE